MNAPAWGAGVASVGSLAGYGPVEVSLPGGVSFVGGFVPFVPFVGGVSFAGGRVPFVPFVGGVSFAGGRVPLGGGAVPFVGQVWRSPRRHARTVALSASSSPSAHTTTVPELPRS